jgi:hypothetical protein
LAGRTLSLNQQWGDTELEAKAAMQKHYLDRVQP